MCIRDSANGTKLTVTYDKLGDSNNKGTITITCADKKEADAVSKKLLETRMLITNQKGVLTNSAGTETVSYTHLQIHQQKRLKMKNSI